MPDNETYQAAVNATYEWMHVREGADPEDAREAFAHAHAALTANNGSATFQVRDGGTVTGYKATALVDGTSGACTIELQPFEILPQERSEATA